MTLRRWRYSGREPDFPKNRLTPMAFDPSKISILAQWRPPAGPEVRHHPSPCPPDRPFTARISRASRRHPLHGTTLWQARPPWFVIPTIGTGRSCGPRFSCAIRLPVLSASRPGTPAAEVDHIVEIAFARNGTLAGTYQWLAYRDGYLLVNSFSSMTNELLEWERTLGLPDPCTPLNPTVAQRKRAVAAKVIGASGKSIPYFTSVAAALGFNVTVTEYAPFRAGISRQLAGLRRGLGAHLARQHDRRGHRAVLYGGYQRRRRTPF